MYLGYQNNEIKFYTEIIPENIEFYPDVEWKETRDEYVLDGEKYVLKDNAWEEKQRQKERERINALTMTKRVLALGLQELGITYTQLKELISSNEQAQLEWDLCVELERGNPLLDVMGAQLGVTPEQLDNMFRIANGEAPVINEAPAEDIESEEDTEQVEGE